jgi:hypothetical protein
MERTHASEIVDLAEVDGLVAPGHIAQTQHAALPTGHAKSLAEGTVLLWTYPDRESYRLKVKHPVYVRKHAAIFRLSTVSVWRFLSAGHSLEALLEYVWKLIRPEFEPFRLEPPSDS